MRRTALFKALPCNLLHANTNLQLSTDLDCTAPLSCEAATGTSDRIGWDTKGAECTLMTSIQRITPYIVAANDAPENRGVLFDYVQQRPLFVFLFLFPLQRAHL